MQTLRLYKNPYVYPDYGSITEYGSSMQSTPVGTGLKDGVIRTKGDMATFMECNYLSLTSDGKTIYGWITDVAFRTNGNYDVSYRVDPFRTFRQNISLGTQFIERSERVTYKRDRLLSSEQAYADVEYHPINHINSNKRVLVVQVRGESSEYTSFSATPVQPNPYQFFVKEYNIHNWHEDDFVIELMEALVGMGETTNIVTMYSIPYMDTSDMQDYMLRVTDGDNTESVAGFKIIDDSIDVTSRLRFDIPIYFTGDVDKDRLMRVDHSVHLVVPDAGVIKIPDEVFIKDDLVLRQEVDIYSGASNYMVVSGDDAENMQHYDLSVRGSNIGSIPVLSDPMQTYVSQNQNALTTSLIGDVASVAGGALMASFGGPGGVGMGIGMASSGITGIAGSVANTLDASTNMSNPPAFLGTAMANNYNNRCWLVIKKEPVDNENQVHDNFGYPLGKVDQLTIPTSGYVKTQGCNISSDGTVPLWAIEEINQIFNNGLMIK